MRLARCYRTVSDMAALVLATMPSAYLLADERRHISLRKKKNRAEAFGLVVKEERD